MPKDVAIYIVVVFKIIGQKPNKKLNATFYGDSAGISSLPSSNTFNQGTLIGEHFM